MIPSSERLNPGRNAAKEDRGRSRGVGGIGDIDDDGRDDFILGSILADSFIDRDNGVGNTNGGEAYVIYGFEP